MAVGEVCDLLEQEVDGDIKLGGSEEDGQYQALLTALARVQNLSTILMTYKPFPVMRLARETEQREDDGTV